MKIAWNTFKNIINDSQSNVYEDSDADNLSYRLKITIDPGEVFECNVMKSPLDNPDLVDYETNYQANSIKVN